MGDPQPRGLYPTVIVAYLVGFLLWNDIGPRSQLFHTEPYDCAYLLVLAGMLWRSGHASQVREYFVGRLAPRKSDLPKVALVLLLLIGWWALCVGAGWITVVGLAESVDTLGVLDDVVTSPVTEEPVYRGVILAVLLQHVQSGRWAALGLSALLFAAIHAPNSVTLLVAITGAGLVLGYAYMATRCVPFCVLCHALWNGSFYLAGRVLGDSV
jgi:membrane protease YdiL (CAAX protease family)